MQESSLVKWVDELQGQIDQVKRDIQSIPTPEPVTPIVVETHDVEIVGGASDVTIAITSDLLDDSRYDALLSIHGVVGSTTADDYYVVDIDNRHVGNTAGTNYPIIYHDDDGINGIVAIGTISELYQSTGSVITITGFANVSGTGAGVATIIAVPKPSNNTRTKKKTTKK